VVRFVLPEAEIVVWYFELYAALKNYALASGFAVDLYLLVDRNRCRRF
jgi:hypothetical protein